MSADDASAYFTELACLFCGGLDTCCTEANLSFAKDKCMAALSGLAAQFESLTYDPQAGEACLSNLRDRTGGCSADSMSMAAGPLSLERLCEGVFVGTTPLGETCNQDAECESSDLGAVGCETLGADVEEVCVVEVRAGEGDPCVETCFDGTGVRSCANAVNGPDPGTPERGKCYLNDGLRCDSSTLRCVRTLDPGADCSFSQECGAFAICAAGTCGPAAGDGDTCEDFSECEEGLLCNEGTCGSASASFVKTCATFDRL